MKKGLLLCALIFGYTAIAQVNYTVTVSRLKAKADPCDGGTPPFCVSAPQDPVFNIWSMDGNGNENTYCWIFEGDADIEYNMWKDIQNVELASETNVNTAYIDIDMAGFEADAPWAATCSSDPLDDEIYDRQFVYQFLLASIPQGTPFTQIVDLNDIYFAEIIIEWIDLTSSVSETSADLGFTIYPNPNEGSFVVNRATTAMDGELRVFDLSGKLLMQQTLDEQTQKIQFHGGSGTYLVQYASEGVVRTTRLIVQ